MSRLDSDVLRTWIDDRAARHEFSGVALATEEWRQPLRARFRSRSSRAPGAEHRGHPLPGGLGHEDDHRGNRPQNGRRRRPEPRPASDRLSPAAVPPDQPRRSSHAASPAIPHVRAAQLPRRRGRDVGVIHRRPGDDPFEQGARATRRPPSVRRPPRGRRFRRLPVLRCELRARRCAHRMGVGPAIRGRCPGEGPRARPG